MSDPTQPVSIHPQALCDSKTVGSGTRIWAFAHVMSGATVGRDCNVGEGAFIESGATLGDRVTVKNGVLIWAGVTIANDVFLGPGVIFTNDRWPRSPRTAGVPNVTTRYERTGSWLEHTHVAEGATIGAGAIIGAGVRIGRWAMVGFGSVVTRDVLPHQLVVGNPARPIGWSCFCGRRMDEPPALNEPCRNCVGPPPPRQG